MRKLPVAIAVSIACHTGLIAWVSAHRESPQRVTISPEVPPAAAPSDPEPVAVTLLDDDTVSPPPIHDLPKGMSHAVSHPASRGTGELTTGPAHPAAETAPPAPGHDLMAMRSPGPPRITGDIPDDYATRFVGDSKPAAQEPAPSGELEPSGGGTYKSEHETFTGHVNRDGTVRIENKPDIGDVHWAGLGIAGRMAVDDYLMHRAGIDPYASEKMKWLDRTRDERVAIGTKYRKDQLAHSAIYMQQNLEWMWRRTRDPAARRRALFEMWDDTAETGDDDLVRGGEAARNYLIGFVRTRLPAGSPDAFSDDELAQLNAHRKSKAVFAPYAP